MKVPKIEKKTRKEKDKGYGDENVSGQQIQDIQCHKEATPLILNSTVA